MENILIPMTDFVLTQEESSTFDRPQIDFYDEELGKLRIIRNYAHFLKQPLALWMFVPCDENGNLLTEPKFPHTFASENSDLYVKKFNKELKAYNEACNRVLFEGFKLIGSKHVELIGNNKNVVIGIGFKNTIHPTIESISNQFSGKITCSPTALKQIYG